MATTDSISLQRLSSAIAIALPFLVATTSLMAAVLYGIKREVLPEAAVLIGLFGPALLAIAFVAVDQNANVRALLAQYFRVRAPLRVYLVALLTVPALLLVTQQLAPLVLPSASWRAFAYLSIPQMIIIPLISIGEELGWRGYLQPRMRRYFPLPVASLVVGAIWALWHLPGYILHMGVVDGVSFGWFCAWVISGAVILGWLYEHSSSVFVTILFHTSANVSFNMILIMPNNAGSPVLFQIFATLAAVSAMALTLGLIKGVQTPVTRTQSHPATNRL